MWSRAEYARRLRAQGQGKLLQLIAWDGEAPAGRGMVLFPEHEEFSTSAVREGCAEVRDVFVAPERRLEGIARAIMSAFEDAVRDAGMLRIGLSVSTEEAGAPARALYDAIGYRKAHGPFITSAVLEGDEGRIPVGAVMNYLVKDL